MIYYTRVLNVCEYIQTYSLACPWLLSWPDFLAWRRALRQQPRNLRSIVSSLAKIGVILVSCSCGKWSPIDADVPNRFRHQPLETICCTHWPEWSCTTYLYFAWNFCIKLEPHQLTVILGLVSTRAIFWKINIPKNWS